MLEEELFQNTKYWLFQNQKWKLETEAARGDRNSEAAEVHRNEVDVSAEPEETVMVKETKAVDIEAESLNLPKQKVKKFRTQLDSSG